MKKIHLVTTETVRPLRWLYHSKSASWIWLVVRLWLGYKWLDAGWSKMFGAEKKAFWDGGAGVLGYTKGAVASSTGAHASVVYGWWLSFMTNFVGPNHSALAKVVTLGEMAIGIGLILGVLTGVAAFFGVGLNFMYMLSGTIGVNPIYALLGFFLILAWQNAGYIGLDRYVFSFFTSKTPDTVEVKTLPLPTSEAKVERKLQSH